MRIYTKTGDGGQTGLLFGGRTWKDDPGPEAYGAVDEAVAALGVVRALADEQLAAGILAVQRDLFVVAAELATAPENRSKLVEGKSLVGEAMVRALEERIDREVEEHPLPNEFVVPGENPVAAHLDVARTAVRRAERRTVTLMRHGAVAGSHVQVYLNRLADYLYVLARAAAPEWQPSRTEEDA